MRWLRLAVVSALLVASLFSRPLLASVALQFNTAGTQYIVSSKQSPGILVLDYAPVQPKPPPTVAPPLTPIPTPTQTPAPTPIITSVAKLSDLLNLVAGTKVRASGVITKWEPSMKAPPATRSDWVLSDSSGFVWITGMMSPKTGTQVTIVGVVVQEKGRLFIQVGL